MQVGSVYHLKVINIPFHEGFEVYPTVEVINRLYAPPGQQSRFAVPIQLTQAELELALSGLMVTRVIYLEDPALALAAVDDRDSQRFFDVPPDEDPLRVADRLGRPMAILRMGSRIPDFGPDDTVLNCGSPPLLLDWPEPTGGPSEAPAAAIEQAARIPRIPLPSIPNARQPAGVIRR
jgi:hypothetical protein